MSDDLLTQLADYGRDHRDRQEPVELSELVGRAASGDVVEVSVGLPLLVTRRRRPRPRWLIAAACIALVVVGAVGVARWGAGDSERAPSVAVTGPDVEGGSDFASAIEASGVLTSPSAVEVAQAMDRDLYKPDTGQTQVSTIGDYVSLRTCRFALRHSDPKPSPECPAGFPAGWSYQTGTVDGIGEVHRGVLGEATGLELIVLDDRYFVASEIAPDAQAPPKSWLIDAVSGEAGPLSWRPTPATLRSPEQALLVCDDSTYLRQCFLPRVVDARDGTIQPLAVPDEAASGLPVAQHGTGRIWIGTAPARDRLGLAYSDDGATTWTEVALPEQVRATSEDLAGTRQKVLEVAADADRVAVTSSWGDETGRDVYVSDDGGGSWRTATPSEPAGNSAHLYVLADGRLVLVWSLESYPVELLASTGADWSALERVDAPSVTVERPPSLDHRDFSVNRAGIALSYTIGFPKYVGGAEVDEPRDVTIDFSSDLTNWTTIERLDN